jgi:hypothetical protein
MKAGALDPAQFDQLAAPVENKLAAFTVAIRGKADIGLCAANVG